jgi:curved DNA-binding protein CbpA
MSGQTARPDWYAVLGVLQQAPQALIDHAYRTLVRRYHPDSRGGTDAGQALSDDLSLRHVMAAYRVIGDPDRRADYDQRSSNPSPSSRTVPVRVQHPRAADAALLTAGPAYWNPCLSTGPIAQLDIIRGAVSRPSRANGLTPQAPSAGPTDSQCRADGMRTETPTTETPTVETPTVETPTAVLDGSELVDALTAEVTQLRIARDSNRRIGMAMGIVMNQLRVEDEQAFDVLRRTSQNTNRKLRDVAEDVIQGCHIQIL